MLAPAQGFYATPGLGAERGPHRLRPGAAAPRGRRGILADGLQAYRAARRLEALAADQAGEADEPDFSVPAEG